MGYAHLAVADETPPPVKAAEQDAEGVAFFETKIRPVLVQQCYKCHSAEAGKSSGGLLLDSARQARVGGERGPAVVPGDPKSSWLLTAISHSDPDLQMPPDGKPLSEAVVADFKTWIQRGAPDPRIAKTSARPATIDLEQGRRHWAYQKPVPHELPTTKNSNWARRELDHFILAKLEAEGLAPTPDAKSAALLRRLHFDLIGLPPTPRDLKNFKQRCASAGLDQALALEVDRLLASPRFGERWGRHWLDVARFAESSGKESNFAFPHAWRYRNYVVDAMNQDRPYDRFLTEQIAGDLLPHENDRQRAELMIATGFLALGPKSLNEMNLFQFLADTADEQIDTLGKAVLASSVACARCHDHKFDPFTMEDYYALAGVFVSSETFFGTAVAPDNNVGGDLLVLPSLEGQVIPNEPLTAKRVEALKAEVAALEKEKQEKQAAAKKAFEMGQDPSKFFSLRDALLILWRKGAIDGILDTVDESGRALPLAMGMADRETIIDAPLLERGDIGKPGESVPRGFPQVIQLPEVPRPPKDASGRLELAQWLIHPDHPLTARVMANRVWHHLLGAGIVRTVDNFGAKGERPSHSELLDHLALRFVDEGWSLKSLIREIVLSRTYRQASTFDPAAFNRDPENRLLWRANKRRLEAEAIRDAMLAVSGNLDTSRPKASLVAQLGNRPIAIIAFDKRVPSDLDGSQHRSVYLPVLRDRLPDVLDLFDFAEPSLVTGARETTNVPLQALYLMNSPLVQKQAQKLAERVMRELKDDQRRLRRAFTLCFSRPPDEEETRLAREYFTAQMQQAGDAKEARLRVMINYCQALLCTAEFHNLD